MNCIITDDEPLAREGIERLLAKHKHINVVAVCKNVQELKATLSVNNDVDIIFLDIEMPYENGLEFLKNNHIDAGIIITSAYQEYALESYELNVLDYLAKPIAADRFNKAIQKANEFVAYNQYQKNNKNYCYIKVDKALEKVYYDDILYVEAMRNYVMFQLANKRLIHYSSIKGIEEKLPQNLFVRVQKSFIVAKSKISQFNHNNIQVGNKSISISRLMRSQVLDRICDYSQVV